MKFQKKNLLVLALAGVVSVLMVGGCNTGDETTTTTASTDGEKDITLKTWAKLPKEAKYINHDRVDGVIVSKDKSWAYFTANTDAALKAWNVAGDTDEKFNENLKKDAQWSDLAIGAKPAAVAAPGEADLTGATKVERMVPTKSGAIFSVSGGGVTGASYFEGKTAKRAWAPNGGGATHVLNNGAAGTAFFGGVLAKDAGAEHPYMIGANFKGSTGAALSAAAAKLGDAYAKATADWTTLQPFFVSGKGNAGAGLVNLGIVVGTQGVSFLADADIGTANDSSAVVAGTPIFGAKTWRQDGATANNDVSSIVVVGNDLYIGLKSAGGAAKTGGVAVLHMGTNPNTVDKADAGWAGKSVIALAVDSANKVWAVTKDAILEVTKDGKIGSGKFDKAAVTAGAAKKDYANPKDGYVGDFPADNITGAVFIGKNSMIVTTSDAGVYTLTTAKKKLDKAGNIK